MPDIDLAATVLFASESAGGAGVSHNLDWLRDTLSSNNPGVTVLGSIGADLKPAIGVPVVDPWSVDVMPADGVDDMQAGLMSNFLQIQQINGFLDVSCMTALGDWRCTHTYQLVLDHITAAHFVKQDMTDNLLSAIYGPVAFHAGVTSAFADLEAAGIPFFGPNCGDHETLTNSPLHYSHTLRLRRWNAVAGVPFGPIRRRVSYNQALWNFYLHHPAPRPEDFAYSGKIDVFGGGDHIWLSSCP